MIKKFLLIVFLIVAVFAGFSQSITNYNFTASNGSFNIITGATSPPITSGNSSSGYFNNIPVGFDFWYMGVRYTTVSASTKGWITPGGSITTPTPTNNLTSGGAPRPIFAPLWDDLDMQANSNISYTTTGASGNRIFTLQYLNAQWIRNSNGNVISFQVKLYETTGKIEYIYSRETSAEKNPSASIGIAAGQTGTGNFLSLNGTGSNPSISSISETTNLSNKPATGQTYSFTSPIPTAPSNLLFTGVSSNGMTINWTDNSNNEVGFVVYRSIDGINFNVVSQLPANSINYIATGLSASTTYYWKVFSITEGGLSNALNGTQATLCQQPNISQVPTTSLLSSYLFNNNASDELGNNPGVLQNNPTATTNRFGIANKAYNFNGSSQYISSSIAIANPNNFSMAIWFKTATVTGGRLIGFGNAQTGASSNYDRHIYMNNAGQLYFGVYPNIVATVNSALSYNDNNWHHATATFSSTNGMALYVDGVLAGSNSTILNAQNYTGYLRIGYDNLNGWTSEPTSFYFNGSLDDVLIYERALNAGEVNTLYKSPDGAGNNGPVCSGSTVTLSATTFSGATYAWSGPNGFTSTLQNPTITYLAANAGVYIVQVNAGGCTSTAYTNVKSTNTSGQWTGAVSTDWADVNNWCSGILPTSLIDVTIAATATRMPTITGTASCKNLIINVGASVTTLATGILQIAGNVINSGTMTNNGTTVFNGTGTQQSFTGVTRFYNLTLNNNNSLILPAATTVVNNLTLSSGILNANNFSIAVGGNWINNASTGAYAAGPSTVFFNGTTSQLIGGTFVTNFNDININNALNAVSLNTNINIAGDLTVAAGIFNIGSYLANRTTVGGILTVSNNATLSIGGTNTYPSNYATNTLVVASTVEYAGTNQVVSNKPYGNLKLSSAAGAVVKTFPNTTMTIAGKLISTIGSGTSVTFTAAANINVDDTVSIGSSTIFNGGSFNINVGGSWLNNGSFNGNTGTVTFVGAGKTVGGTGLQNFNHITVTAPLVNFLNAGIILSGNLVTTGSGSFVQANGGTITMTGTATTISGTGISIHNLTVSGTVTTTASLNISGNLLVNGSFSGTIGTIGLTGASKSMTGTGTIGFFGLSVSGSIITTANFSINSSCNVVGSFTATAGTATFTGVSILSGIANLFNTTINGTSLQLSANSTLGIANSFTISSGMLNTASSMPNTVNFNGTGAQLINAISYDNLIFSNGSNKTAAGNITVNGNITIATATTFIAGVYIHSIYGNWVNAGTFTAGTSTIQFLGVQTQNIIGATTFNIATVNHTSNTTRVVLQNNIGVAVLNMSQGNMLTGTNTVTITTTRTGPGIILGNIQRMHAFTTGLAYEFEGPNNSITFSSVTAVSNITVSVTKGAVTSFPLGGAIRRAYNIVIPSGTYNATLRLHYEDDELNGNVENSMTLWKFNGTNWNNIGKTSNSTISNYVEQTSLTDITNRWTLSDAMNAVRWNGTVSNDWNTAANWTVLNGSATRPPSPTDNVYIGDTLFVNQPTITTTVNVKSILLNSTKAVTLQMQPGGTLTTGDIKGEWGTSAAHNIYTNNQNIFINGDLLLSNGTTGNIINLYIENGNIDIAGLLTQNADASIVYSGSGNISVSGDYNYTSGIFTASTGTFTYKGSDNQLVGAVNYNNMTVNKTGGIATLSAATTIGGNLLISGGEMDNETITTVVGNVTIGSGAMLSNTDVIKVGGNWLNNGNFIGLGVNIIFNGSGTQTISASTFNNLEINKPVGSTALLTGAVTLKGNLKGTSGTLDISNYLFNRDVLGGTATMGDSATLIIGANNAPNKFANYSIATSSTVIFNGTDTQHLLLPGITYGNLTFKNAGNKILYTPITVMGKLLIESNARFSAGAHTITLYGDWENNATFLANTSEVVCAGTAKTIADVTTFNKMTITGSYTYLNHTTYNDKLTITSTGSITAANGIVTTLNADLLNSGDLYNLGTTTFTGDRVQTLSLINAIRSVSAIVNFNGTIPPLLVSTSAPLFGVLNINNTGGVSPSVGWTVLNAMTIGTGASFHGGVSSHNIYGTFTNNGTVSSEGTISFIPTIATTINLGTNFSSAGRVYFGGAGALSILGTPVSFGNININNSNVAGITPSSNWIITKTLRIVAGSTFNASNYIYTIGGNILVNGILNKGTSTFVMNGSSSQDIFCTSPFNNITINKTGDSTTLSSNINVNGNLHFIAGKLFTGVNKVSLLASASITGTAQNTGWVYGNLQKNAAIGATTRTFEVGDRNNYTPISVTFGNVSTSGELTANTIGVEHPNISNSSIDGNRSLNRYWKLTNSGIVYNNYSATLNYIASDLDVGATATNIDIQRFNGSSWIIPLTTIRNTTSVTATGLTNFGELTAGEICNKGTAISYLGSPYCTEAVSAMVTLTGTTGGIFSAQAGLSINATTGSINLISSLPGNYIVSYTIAATGSCPEFVAYANITVAIAGTWTGAVNDDWNNGANWACGGVPLPTSNITVPSGISIYPIIDSIVELNDISIQNTSSLTVTGTLKIAGAIINSGLFVAADGTIEMNGISSQIIPSDAFDNNAVQHLIINNTSTNGVSLGGPLDIYGSLTYIGTGKKFVTNDALTLKSTPINTAWVGDMTDNTIIGKATVERFITARKAWRFLSVPTNTLQTIKEAWQEGGINVNDNPSVGFGLQITSNRSSWAADGFDNLTPGATIKTYDTSINNYVGVTSTNNLIKNTVGYMTFVRGNRTVVSPSIPATTTVLRTTGSLYTGDQPTITVGPDKLASIGNPYAAAIDVRNITKIGLRDFFYLWDPNLGGQYGLGAFQVLSKDVTNNYVITPGGGSFGAAGSINNLIQSGQAFYVQGASTGGALTFKENVKANGSNLVSFTNSIVTAPASLRVTLNGVNADNSTYIADGVFVNFNDAYSNAVDEMDAIKQPNSGENLSVKRNNHFLIIERRFSVGGADTVFLNFANAKFQNYQLSINTTDLGQPGLIGFLEDAYLNTSTVLDLNGLTTVNFTVANIAGSNAVNRFKIVFKPATVLPITFTTVTAAKQNKYIAVNWKTTNELNIGAYEVEKSTDGLQFAKVFTTPAQNNNTKSYEWLDENPVENYNFYRIKSIDVNGHSLYSKVVKVWIGLKSEITVYPNPVVNASLCMQFENMASGIYAVRILNYLGHVVLSTKIAHNVATKVETITLTNNIAKGLYNLEVIAEDGSKKTIPISILQ